MRNKNCTRFGINPLTGILVFVIVLVFCASSNAQNIAITDDESYTADSSAMLDVKSLTKGMLVPRMTSDQRNAITDPATGLLVFDINEISFYFFNGSAWVNLSAGNIWDVNDTSIFLTDPLLNLGVGTATPVAKMEVKGDNSIGVEDPLFSVINPAGDTVFAVYPEGVRIYVQEGDAKGRKGGFAIGGFSLSKEDWQEYLRVTPDSIRMYVDQSPDEKGRKGGFAIGGFPTSKGLEQELLLVTYDSVRVYIDNSSSKGRKGGFAVGGFGTAKGTEDNFMYLTPVASSIGQYNTMLGFQAGKNASTLGAALRNVVIGYQAGYNLASGGYDMDNIIIGYKAGYGGRGTNNVIIGTRAAENKSLPENNVIIGTNAGKNVTGNQNVIIGMDAGLEVSGAANTIIGLEAVSDGNGGINNVVLGRWAGVNNDGNGNVFIGNNAGYSNTSGIDNVYIGISSGLSNKGHSNIFIGAQAGRNETSASNKLFIENSSISTPLIYGDFELNKVQINGDICWTNNSGVCSDIRYKKDIVRLNNALEKLQGINGIYFNWNKKDYPEMVFSDDRQIGIVAQEVEEIFPELVNTDSRGYMTVDYGRLTPVLVEAVKEQQSIINELEKKLDKIDELEQQIRELKELISEN